MNVQMRVEHEGKVRLYEVEIDDDLLSMMASTDQKAKFATDNLHPYLYHFLMGSEL